MPTNPQTVTLGREKERPAETVAKLVAVIDIGASAIRMAIAEILPDGAVRTLEALAQGVSLGKDTFTDGSIAPETIEDTVRVLKIYRGKLEEYRITRPDQIHVVATSAVREAVNRFTFLNRIYVATGLHVEPFDEAAVNRVTYLGVLPLFEFQPRLKQADVLIIEVGGGSTEVLLFQRGDVVYADTFRLGALRLRKTLENYGTPTGKVRDIMESQIQRIVNQVRDRVPRDATLTLVALGGDVRFAAARLFPERTTSPLTELPLAKLVKFTDKTMSQSVDEVAHKYRLPFADAESLGPALLTYAQLAEAFELEQIFVSNVNLRDGLIKEMALREAWTENFVNQILLSAVTYGRRFRFDEKHGRHVAELSRQLFRALQSEHQLPARFEVLLSIAALLHDIGYAVSTRSHHKHSMYLIENSELFGLNRSDLQLAAMVARYHRRSSPSLTHVQYQALDWESRIHVAKLAAMLRIADSLDRANTQRIKEIRCTLEKGRLVISVPTADDLSLEQLAVRQKSGLFKEVFGMTVLLRNAPEI